MYKKNNCSSTLKFFIKDILEYYNLEDTKRTRDKLKKDLLSLFNFGFVDSVYNKKTLSRLIYKMTLHKNHQLELIINGELFSDNEMSETSFDLKLLKDYWDSIKSGERNLKQKKLSFKFLKQSFLLYMTLGSYGSSSPVKYLQKLFFLYNSI